MAELKLDRTQSVHLVGVGGAGISAIALILATMGHRVSGVDVNETPAWPQLQEAGVEVEVVAASALFASGAGRGVDIVAHSSAFTPSPTEVAGIEADGGVVANRGAILAAICAERATIAVSGTHGKTSTTAMLATLLCELGEDPSFLVGATPVGLGEAARWAGPDGLFVVEADESDGSFMDLGAATAVVTNVEEDHLEHWGSLDAIEAGFDRFLAEAATSVVCIDRPIGDGTADPRVVALAARHGSVTVGEAPEARYRIHSVDVDRLTTRFGLRVDGTEIGPVAIATPGRHHARNAAVALATAIAHGVDPGDGARALSAYKGVSRRFEVVGEARGVTIVDDYAHNPGKVAALLGSAAEAGWARVVVVFQPHRHSRTHAQGAGLVAALTGADLVGVTEIYGAGEEVIEGVSGLGLIRGVLAERPWAEVAWTPGLDDALAWLKSVVREGDLVLTVGAGNVHTIGPRLLEELRR